MVKNTFIQTIVFIVVFLFFFVSLFLFTNNKGKNLSNRLLGIVFICFGFWTFNIYGILSFYINYPYLAYIFNLGLWLIGPGLLLYTESVLYEDFKIDSSKLLHLIPFVLFLLISVFIFHIHSIEYKTDFIKEALKNRGIANWGSNILVLGYLFTYTYLAFRSIRRYSRVASNKLSNQHIVYQHWLKFLLWGIVIIYLTLFIFSAFQFIFWGGKIPVFSLLLIFIVLLVFITAILLKSLKQPEIFSDIRQNELYENKEKKYSYSTLNEGDKNEISAKLEQFMQSEKPYLNADLTINDISEKLEINVKSISQVINEKLGLRFFDYVNKYRIEESKSIIKNPPDPKMTILEIIYSVGFNSKSSFNTAFKKFTGETPSSYKNKVQNR